MNERILKLALDAGLLNYVDNETPRRYFVHGHADLEEVEKFAELIVRECLEQIDRIRDGCEDDGEDQQALGADWAGLAVARHFGVEE